MIEVIAPPLDVARSQRSLAATGKRTAVTAGRRDRRRSVRKLHMHVDTIWSRWLIAVTTLVLAMGLAFVVLPGPTQTAFNLIAFASPTGSAAFGAVANTYITFVSAVLGAVMFGWAVALLFVLAGPFRRGEPTAWNTVAVSLAAWFVPDTACSLIYGFGLNAAFNAVLAVLFAIPLAATYRSFAVRTT